MVLTRWLTWKFLTVTMNLLFHLSSPWFSVLTKPGQRPTADRVLSSEFFCPAQDLPRNNDNAADMNVYNGFLYFIMREKAASENVSSQFQSVSMSTLNSSTVQTRGLTLKQFDFGWTNVTNLSVTFRIYKYQLKTRTFRYMGNLKDNIQ